MTPSPTLDSGDSAWMLTASLLVLMMTLPGLALFYGGLVRARNVLSVLMQCLAIVVAGDRALGRLRLQRRLQHRRACRPACSTCTASSADWTAPSWPA